MAAGAPPSAALAGALAVGVATRPGRLMTTKASAPASRIMTAVNHSARGERRPMGLRASPPMTLRPRPPLRVSGAATGSMYVGSSDGIECAVDEDLGTGTLFICIGAVLRGQR